MRTGLHPALSGGRNGGAKMTMLVGKTIAITEARRAREMAEHIRKLGGIAVVAPALQEVPAADQEPVRMAIGRICEGRVQWAIFLTGVGARAILGAAEAMGCRQAFVAALNGMTVAARGPKPIAVLREAGVRVDVVPEQPTSEGLVKVLQGHDLRGRAVALQLYGEPNPFLVEALRGRGATLLEIQPYAWALPEDQGPLQRLVLQAIAGHVDAVAFTSGPQVRNLFAVAARLDLVPELRHALAARVPVAAVGEVTEQALAAYGIVPRIRPPRPTMGALVMAIARGLGASSPREVAGGYAAARGQGGAGIERVPVGAAAALTDEP